MRHRTRSGMFAALLTLVLAGSVGAQNPRDVEIQTVKVTDSIYMLIGQGGNIGVCIGEDGTFMIDDQFAPLTGKITEAVGNLTDHPVRFLINTHHHFDHTGGNENFGEAGAIIVAHENVRRTMSQEQFIEAFDSRTPAAPEVALPVITFSDAMTFHWNGHDINLFHVADAHTNGDTIVHFRDANVLHMGDTFFNGFYPFIDASTNGSIYGMIDAIDQVMPHCNLDTQIIPGHGPLAGVRELRAFRSMLVTVRDRIDRMMHEGMSREEIVAAKPTADFDAEWGDGFLPPDQWVGIVYDGMARARARHEQGAGTDHEHQPEA